MFDSWYDQHYKRKGRGGVCLCERERERERVRAKGGSEEKDEDIKSQRRNEMDRRKEGGGCEKKI
jgi:hypothetical protein